MKATRGTFEWRIGKVRDAIYKLTRYPGLALEGAVLTDVEVEETGPDYAVVRDWGLNKFYKVGYTFDDEKGEAAVGTDWTEIEQTWSEVQKVIKLLVPIQKSDGQTRRISLGVVLEPDSEDLQGDVMSAVDIELSAHDYMEKSQAGGFMHAELVEGAKVVESYLAPCDFTVETADGEETVKKGSWVLAMKWPEEVWTKIEKGELTGYSVGGTGVRLPLEEEGDGEAAD